MSTPIPDTPHIVAFTSGKGGCGKTTLAVNFAYTVYQSSEKVLSIDFDVSNRGSTGLFADWIPNGKNYLTLTKIIRGEYLVDDELLPLLEIKPGYFFVPAISPAEADWEEPVHIGLEEFTTDLKNKLFDIAVRLNLPCIVLDCFCGVDLLTTAGASVAHDTIIVNEPDIVTFTGSIVLLKHLKTNFKKLKIKPNLRFVINRVRATQSVKELTLLYKDNLQKEIEDSVLAHFPYNDRIFQHFGKYPFMTELLPRSLFAKKFELLTLLLFEGKRPDLIKPKVRNWSTRKIKSVYQKSIDKSSVDSQYLIYKTTSFPVFVGALLLLFLILFRTVPVTPFFSWFVTLLLITGIGFLFASRILHSIWLSARLNFTQSLFNFRLGNRIGERTRFTKGIISCLAGSMMGIAVLFLGAILALLSIEFAKSMFDTTSPNSVYDYEYSYFYESDPYSGFKDSLIVSSIGGNDYERGLMDAMINVSLGLPIRNLDLSDHEVHREEFYEPFNQDLGRSIDVFEPNRITVSNSRFIASNMPRNLLQMGGDLSGLMFEYCEFPTDSTMLDLYYDRVQELVRARDNFYYSEDVIHSVLMDISAIPQSDLRDLSIIGMPGLFGVIVQESELDNIELSLSGNQSFASVNNSINGRITISNLDTSITADPVYFYHHVDDNLSGITFKGNVHKIPVLNQGYLLEAMIDKYFVEYLIYQGHQNLSYFQNELRQYTDSLDVAPMDAFQQQTMAAIKEDVTTASLNLIELYMLTGKEDHKQRARNLVYETREITTNYIDLGILQMLELKLAILEDDPVQIEGQLENWIQWLDMEPPAEQAQLYSFSNSENSRFNRRWRFQLFNSNFRYLSSQLTVAQIEQLKLVVKSVLDNQLDSATFRSEFNKEYTSLDADSAINKKLEMTSAFFNEWKPRLSSSWYY